MPRAPPEQNRPNSESTARLKKGACLFLNFSQGQLGWRGGWFRYCTPWPCSLRGILCLFGSLLLRNELSLLHLKKPALLFFGLDLRKRQLLHPLVRIPIMTSSISHNLRYKQNPAKGLHLLLAQPVLQSLRPCFQLRILLGL